MQIDDELDVCKDAFTYVQAFIGHRCASLAHAYPGLLAPLTSEDSASQQFGLAMAARTWRVIASVNSETAAPSRICEINAGARVFACSGAEAWEVLQSMRSSKVGVRAVSTRTASTGARITCVMPRISGWLVVLGGAI